MHENPANVASLAGSVRTLLRTIAELLRHTRHLGPDAQTLLADLIDELGVALESPEVPNAKAIAKLDGTRIAAREGCDWRNMTKEYCKAPRTAWNGRSFRSRRGRRTWRI